MTGEINKDFYCSAGLFNKGECEMKALGRCEDTCQNYHRKHPTPAQFKEEYGFDYPDDGAVWALIDYNASGLKWELMEYWRYKQIVADISRLDKDFDVPTKIIPVVVACTPYGKPPEDWRPE